MAGEYFEVRVEGAFRASHRVDADGEVAPLHEHRWSVAARAGARELDTIAIVVDFRRLRADLDKALAAVDGQELDRLADFAGTPADATAVGRWLWQRLRAAGVAAGYRIVAVEVECDESIRWVIGEDGAAAHAPV